MTNRSNRSNDDPNNEEFVVSPSNRVYPLPVSSTLNDCPLILNRHVTSRQVKLIVISFGLRLLCTGLIWDHFVHKYHDLLMVLSNNPTKRKMQAQAFKSIGMWLIMWFWRLGNACAILEHLVITTFFNRLWEYILYTSYVGWAFLIILTLFTQIHSTEVSLLNRVFVPIIHFLIFSSPHFKSCMNR